MKKPKNTVAVMKFNKVKLEGNYTTIPNALITSTFLTDTEFRLCSYLLSNADGFPITQTYTCTALKMHPITFKKAFKKLIDFNYILIESVKEESNETSYTWNLDVLTATNPITNNTVTNNTVTNNTVTNNTVTNNTVTNDRVNPVKNNSEPCQELQGNPITNYRDTLSQITGNKKKQEEIKEEEKKEKTKKENFSDFENFLPDAITSPSTSSSTNFSNQYNRLEMLNSIEFLIDRNFHKEHLLTFYQEYLKECNNNPIDFIEYTKLVLLTKLLQLAAYFKNYHIEENYSNFIKEINKAENYLTYINPKEVNYIKSLPNFNQVIQLLDKIKK